MEQKVKKPRRARRSFTDEFKAGAVRLVLEEGRSVGAVARDLDLTETALRDWVRQAKIDAGRGPLGALSSSEKEELARLRRENKILRMERDILKSRGLLREREHVKFAWIDVEKAFWPVRVLCRSLRVSPAGYYAWRRRPESARAIADRCLGVLVRESFERSRGIYGRPRVHADLAEDGVRTSAKRVGRLMREQGLRGRMRRPLTANVARNKLRVAARMVDSK